VNDSVLFNAKMSNCLAIIARTSY